MSPVRKPGRPRTNFPSPSEFGIELSFEELGECLGMSRYKAKALAVENGIPLIVRGNYKKVHRAVAELLVSGEWWLGQHSKQEKEEATQDAQATNPIAGRRLLDADFGRAVHGPAGTDGIVRRPVAIAKKA